MSGNVYGFGFGALDRTNAQVTIWSGEYWSTVGSDFWFGWLSIAGGFLVLASTVGFVKSKRRFVPILFVLFGGILSILALVMAVICYRPQTFVINGQIDDYPIDIGILRVADANITIGIGPWLSLAGGILSVVSITSAYFKRNKES
ncbi:MAG: hypothetical protein QXZ70_07485 [Candidatus Bathyarchaeia archaeon]